VARHLVYQGAVYPVKVREDAYVVNRLDAPTDLRRVTYGGRFYNRAPRSHIDLLHSFDGGQTWECSWSLTRTERPRDVIHYETVNPPPGCRSVPVKFLMNTTDPSPSGCGGWRGCRVPVIAAAPPVCVQWQGLEDPRNFPRRSRSYSVKWRSGESPAKLPLTT